MNGRIKLIKNVLIMFVVVAVFIGTTGCGKPGSVLNWYPKAERLEGKMTSNVDHEIVIDSVDLNDTVQIKGEGMHSVSRWWIDVECDYWASCFMRCDGSKKQCRKLAEDSNFTVNSISPF
jgi:hypothetical protein